MEKCIRYSYAVFIIITRVIARIPINFLLFTLFYASQFFTKCYYIIKITIIYLHPLIKKSASTCSVNDFFNVFHCFLYQYIRIYFEKPIKLKWKVLRALDSCLHKTVLFTYSLVLRFFTISNHFIQTIGIKKKYIPLDIHSSPFFYGLVKSV